MEQNKESSPYKIGGSSEELFRTRLLALVKRAKQQGMCVTEEQVKEAFPDMNLDEGKLALIYEYLKSSKITIGEEADLDNLLTKEDKNYLEQYLEEINGLPAFEERELKEICRGAFKGEKEAKDKLFTHMLPKVVEIARLYAGQGILLEDLIGEGNVALAIGMEMLAVEDGPEALEGALAKGIMDALEEAVMGEVNVKEQDDKVVKRINSIAKAAKELAEDLCREVTVKELSEETEFTEEEIADAMKLTGNKIDFMEKAEEQDGI